MAKSSVTTQRVPAQPNSGLLSLENIFFICVVLFVAFIRYRLISIPLERDEGEYAYMGKLILEGILPYKEAYNMKLPGTYYMYAFFMLVFGKSIEGIHTGLLFMTLGSMTLLYTALKKMHQARAGLYAAIAFGALTFSPNVLGFAAHATHFVAFYACLGLFFIAWYLETKKSIYSLWLGLAFGMAFLMKQQAVFFLVFMGLALIFHHVFPAIENIKKAAIDLILYTLGVFVPYIFVLVLMIVGGNFDKFWFWTVEYASKYASGVSWTDGKVLFGMTFGPIFSEYVFWWILFFISPLLFIIGKHSLKWKIWILSFSLAAILTIVPGFYFRQHYFIGLIPGFAVLFGVALQIIEQKLVEITKVKSFFWLTLAVCVIPAIMAMSKGKGYYFKIKPQPLCKMIYGSNPFVESLEIAKYIDKNASKDATIAVLGSEPQLFFYANRKSATGYIYTYGMVEIHDFNQKMQDEMIAEIESKKPEYIVFCRVHTSWLTRPGSPTRIFDWFNSYVQNGYQLVGIADLVAPSNSVYRFDNELSGYGPQGQEYVLLYKRIENIP